MPWYRLKSGAPYFSATPRTDLGPEIPEPGSEPVDLEPATEDEKPKKGSKKK
jgi:hypothetical protein